MEDRPKGGVIYRERLPIGRLTAPVLPSRSTQAARKLSRTQLAQSPGNEPSLRSHEARLTGAEEDG